MKEKYSWRDDIAALLGVHSPKLVYIFHRNIGGVNPAFYLILQASSLHPF